MAIKQNNNITPQFDFGTTEIRKMYFGSSLVYDPSIPISSYISASGGTITTDGDFKVHTFSTVGTSNFVIHQISNVPANNSVQYLIIGGGGSGACADRFTANGGGGGAGGTARTGSFTVAIDTYAAITGNKGAFGGFGNNGVPGGNSSIFGITATGGGGGTYNGPGGSNADFSGASPGGGGAGAGGNAPGDDGGVGIASSITGTSVTYAKGGKRTSCASSTQIGQGGNGVEVGGSCNPACLDSVREGIVILRYKFQ